MSAEPITRPYEARMAQARQWHAHQLRAGQRQPPEWTEAQIDALFARLRLTRAPDLDHRAGFLRVARRNLYSRGWVKYLRAEHVIAGAA